MPERPELVVTAGAFNGRIELPDGFRDLWTETYATMTRGKWSALVAATFREWAEGQNSLEVEIGQRKLMRETGIRNGRILEAAIAELVEDGIVIIRPAGDRRRTAYRLVLIDPVELARVRSERLGHLPRLFRGRTAPGTPGQFGSSDVVETGDSLQDRRSAPGGLPRETAPGTPGHERTYDVVQSQGLLSTKRLARDANGRAWPAHVAGLDRLRSGLVESCAEKPGPDDEHGQDQNGWVGGYGFEGQP